MKNWFKQIWEKIKLFWSKNWKRMAKEFATFFSVFLLSNIAISETLGLSFFAVGYFLAIFWFLVQIARGGD